MTAVTRKSPSAGTVRMSADERRVAVVRAAVKEFARGGLHGTSTAAIAQRVGVSQPYLFRLFATKKDIFLAAVDYGFRRVEETFLQATEGLEGLAAKHAMSHAYQRFLDEDSDLLHMQLNAYVASADPEIQVEVRASWDRLDALVRERTGLPPGEMTDFFARGMLCNVIAALELPRARYFGDFLPSEGAEVDCELCAAKAAEEAE
ncbi:TetR/AcrR family transcriptional regulator [Yinghuangia sp. ASG 101]|uniref:TetR/AcrR family transcriptional regulator n=1 Tax=Yinghuangia sp. ASG 101 TaxID=2896848 RepID=UPI001E437C26|nr:helix-turn-helix domain-containing protein [Yinghuangia sp. ASG 101]UGQ14639.1 TetR/AcrR family transcriptional regulator [Yinghuangia sp. ASG 101]